jgi:hypothetical protein
MQNCVFRLLPLACLFACLLACGEGAQIDEPTLPLELDLSDRTYLNNETYVYAGIWRGDTLFDPIQAEALLLDYFWTIDGKITHRKLEQILPNGSDGRSEVLARFTVVDFLGDTLSDTLRVKLPLWVKLVSPVDGYVASVGERIEFIYQSNRPVQVELWQCKNESCGDTTLVSPALAEQAKLDSGFYYWGIQGTQSFRSLEVRPQEQP